MNKESQLASAALDALHGARGLPAEKAASILRDFLDSIRSSNSNNSRMTEATLSLETLIQKLEAEGSAPDDDWQSSIESMLSLAYEVS
jgi:hypothetical protein